MLRSKTNQKIEPPLSRKTLLFILIPIIIIIIVGGYLFYLFQETHQKQQIEDELTSIAHLKTDQIAMWRQERLADAEYFMASSFYIDAVAEWLETGDPELKQEISSRLQELEKHYPYQDINLVTPDGDVLININDTVTNVESAALMALPTAFAENKAVFVDFHNIGNGHAPHLDVIAPLFIDKNNSREPLAAIVLSIDPNYILYPLIKYWPTPSNTAETLIIRSEGDQVLFLNELRHQSGTALSLRIPVSQKDVPSVAAISGQEGFFEGRDYRGVEVISVISRIPDSPWYMIAKEDKDEAYAEMRLNSLLIFGTFTGLLLVILGGGVLLWSRRQRLSLEALYRSELERKALMRHFEYLVKYANDMILLVDNNSKFVDANERAQEIYGYTKEEFYQLHVQDLIPPSEMESYSKRRNEITEKGSIISEALHRKKDGTVFPVELSIKTINVDDVLYEQAIIRDITDRKLAEEALSHSEAFLKSVIENSPYAMCITDSKGTSIQLNQACRNLMNVTDEEIIDKYNIFEDNIIQEQGYMPLVDKVFREGETVRFTVKYDFSRLTLLALKNDKTITLDTTISAVRGNSGMVTNSIIQYTDITERVRMEEQLQLINRLYALLSDINQAIVRTKEINTLYKSICRIAVEKGRFRMAWIGLIDAETGKVNPAVHFGYDNGYLKKFPEIRKSYPDYNGPTDIALMEGIVVACNDIETDVRMVPWRIEALKRGYRSVAAIPLKQKDRAIGNFTIYADKQEFFTEMEIDLLNEIGTDISYAIDSIKTETERLRIEKELRLSEEKLTGIFNTVPAGIGITVNHVIQEVNNSLCEITGYSRDELIGKNTSILYTSTHDCNFVRKEMYRQLNDKAMYTDETRWKRNDGEMIDVLMTASKLDSSDPVSSIVFTALNITERKHQEEERQKIGKLESIGLLAGGIAHDFNNILTAILGNINLARIKTAPGDEINNLLMESEKASIRAQSLTQQLLTFAKGGAPVKKKTSIAEIVREAASFVLMGSNVKCEFSIPDNLWKADIDPGQITQVISNLVINAQQSMPDGGIINIYCENITLLENQELTVKHALKEGNYVRITITDHGTGIPAEHLPRIFDPYFSTKEKGSGLGLTIVYSIVRNHGGYINVDSQVGSGSTFYLYLPASKTRTKVKEIERKQLPLEKGRILVMDDEEVVRNVARHMLKYLGYEDVSFVVDGEEAVKLYKEAMESGQPFSVVILDLTIPGGMGGEDTIKQLLDIDPDVNAIVSSGYTNEKAITEYKEYGFSGIVTKPYTLEQLSDVLNEAFSRIRKKE